MHAAAAAKGKLSPMLLTIDHSFNVEQHPYIGSSTQQAASNTARRRVNAPYKADERLATPGTGPAIAAIRYGIQAVSNGRMGLHVDSKT